MSQDGVSAYDIVNKYSEKDLADIIFQFGDEKKSRQIAKRIVQQRNISPIGTTIQLANIVRSVVRNGSKIDPATKTFQAIRICVNDELKNLQRVLIASEILLKDKGRLVVVSFHSLEDKIVKNFLNEKSGKIEGVSRYIPSDLKKPVGVFKILTKKAVLCSEEEKNNNIRARSARLRAVICNRGK
jgi:16S rRNA (cytosine1402-N4)-methyltransferase